MGLMGEMGPMFYPSHWSYQSHCLKEKNHADLLAGLALWVAHYGEEPGFHGDRCVNSSAGHRRKHRLVQCGQYSAAEEAAGHRSGSFGAVPFGINQAVHSRKS